MDYDTKEANQLDDLDRKVLEFINPSTIARPPAERRREKVIESSSKYCISSSIDESLDGKTGSVSADWDSEENHRSGRVASWDSEEEHQLVKVTNSSLGRQESSDWEPNNYQRIWDKVCPPHSLTIQIAEHDARIEKLTDCFLHISSVLRQQSSVADLNIVTTHKRHSQ
jgi:hypothetical protein